MASERDGVPFLMAHLSISAIISGFRRSATSGSVPVAGRPGGLRITLSIDRFAMFTLYRKGKPNGSANFRPALTGNTEDKSMPSANSQNSTAIGGATALPVSSSQTRRGVLSALAVAPVVALVPGPAFANQGSPASEKLAALGAHLCE
jgi:hypothetical protein